MRFYRLAMVVVAGALGMNSTQAQVLKPALGFEWQIRVYQNAPGADDRGSQTLIVDRTVRTGRAQVFIHDPVTLYGPTEVTVPFGKDTPAKAVIRLLDEEPLPFASGAWRLPIHIEVTSVTGEVQKTQATAFPRDPTTIRIPAAAPTTFFRRGSYTLEVKFIALQSCKAGWEIDRWVDTGTKCQY